MRGLALELTLLSLLKGILRSKRSKKTEPVGQVNREKMIKQEFKVGDEFVFRLNGVRGYVVLAFKGYVVKLGEREGRLLPEGYLASDEKKEEGRDPFEPGDKVRIIAGGKKGKILDINQFYVVQFKNGQLSVLIQKVMAKGMGKIISPIPPGACLGDLVEGGIFPRTN